MVIVGLGPGGLDSWNPRKWKGLGFESVYPPNHRAPNQQLTIKLIKFLLKNHAPKK